MKILKVYFSEKFSGKIRVILGNATVSIFELVEKLYNSQDIASLHLFAPKGIFVQFS